MRDDMQRGWVYFIECGDFIKIGFTVQSIEKRLSGIRSGNPFPVRLLYVRQTVKRWEREMHERFAHIRHQREWFKKAPEIIRAIEGYNLGGP